MAKQSLLERAAKLRSKADELVAIAASNRKKAMFPVGTKVRIVNATWERFNCKIGVVRRVISDNYEYFIDFPGRDECSDCGQCPGHKRWTRIGDKYVERAPSG